MGYYCLVYNNFLMSYHRSLLKFLNILNQTQKYTLKTYLNIYQD